MRLLRKIGAFCVFGIIDAELGFHTDQLHVAEVLHLICQHVPERKVHGSLEYVEFVSVNSHRRFFLPAFQLLHGFAVQAAGRIFEFVNVTAVVLAVFHVFQPFDSCGRHRSVFLICDSGEHHLRLAFPYLLNQFVIILEPA